mgnify:CR=1 FL=1
MQINGKGKQGRDFVYIDDVVDATILGIEKEDANGQVFNVGSGVATSVKEVADSLKSYYESDINISISGKYRLGDIRHNYADINKIKKLRQSTGAGFKDCNLAIKESNGDLDKAVEISRVKGISKASKKMSRDAKEGVVVVSGNDGKKSIIEVNCETDFVAKNDNFINFVKELSDLNNSCNSNTEELKKSKIINI